MQKIKKRHSIKKYFDGGDFMDVGQAAGQGASIGMNPSLLTATGGLSAPIGAAAGAYTSISGKLANKYSETKFGKSTLGKVAAFGVNPMFGIQNLLSNKKRKEEAKRVKREAFAFNEDQNELIENSTKGVLQTYNTEGNNVSSFAFGGNMNPNKINTNPKNTTDLGDGMLLFKGASHENGGIPVDTNSDMIEDAEVEGDEVYEDRGQRIYSDRLKPSEEVLNEVYNQTGFKVKGTYADIAKKLGKEKGKIINTGSTASQNKEDLTSERIESSLDLIFENQETTKPQNNQQEFKYGGSVDPNKKTDPNKKNNFSYKKINDDGSITIVSNLPNPGEFSNEEAFYEKAYPEEINNKNKEEVTETKKNYIPKPVGKKLKLNIMKDSPSFYGDKNKWSKKTRSFANGGIIRQEGVPKHAGGYSYQLPIISSYAPIGQSTTGLGFNNSQIGTENFASATGNQTGFSNSNMFSSGLSAPSGGGGNGGGLGSFMSNGGGSDVLGQGMNLLSYYQNKRDLNKMKINQKPLLNSTPRYSYQDESSYDKNLIDKDLSTVSTAIQNSSLQNKSANYAKVKSSSYNAKNQISNQEATRKLNYTQRYNENLNRNNLYNTNLTNTMNTENLDRFNQKIGLDIGNRQALYSGITGNMQVSQQRDSDQLQSLLQAAGQGDTESLTRFLKANPDIAKRLKLTSISQ